MCEGMCVSVSFVVFSLALFYFLYLFCPIPIHFFKSCFILFLDSFWFVIKEKKTVWIWVGEDLEMI